jgi:hypothetical protein
MALIVSATGCAAFLSSFILLHVGTTSMAVRYPISIVVAYVVFLLLLRLWLRFQKPRPPKNDSIDVLDLPVDLIVDLFDSASSSTVPTSGDFGGGGAGGSWHAGASTSHGSVSAGSSGGGIGVDPDFGEGCLVIIAVLAIVAGALATFYVVWIAPSLLAEILFDGFIAAGFYRQMKRLEKRHWSRAAIRRTIVPALLALLFFSIGGWVMQRAAPKARSIGDFWKIVVLKQELPDRD